MAINKRRPFIYDAEYPTVNAGNPGIDIVRLFNRSQSTQVNYNDASDTPVSRAKGFEDTNLTEDGRVTETGIIVRGIGVNIIPGVPVSSALHAADVSAFLERGYAVFKVNESQEIFTARIKDLKPRVQMMANGAYGDTTADTADGALTMSLTGELFEFATCRIERGVRFGLELRWNDELILPSETTPRIEAELWGDSIETNEAATDSRVNDLAAQRRAQRVAQRRAERQAGRA